MNIKVREEIDADGITHRLIAEGPSPHDIRKTLHERLVQGVNGKVELEFARQLVALGWTPPPGHPVLNEEESSGS